MALRNLWIDATNSSIVEPVFKNRKCADLGLKDLTLKLQFEQKVIEFDITDFLKDQSGDCHILFSLQYQMLDIFPSRLIVGPTFIQQFLGVYFDFDSGLIGFEGLNIRDLNNHH